MADQMNPSGGQTAPSGQPPVANQSLTEQEIRSLRGNLSDAPISSNQPVAPPPLARQPEPSLNVPKTAPTSATAAAQPMFDADEPTYTPSAPSQAAPAASVDELIASEGSGNKKTWWIIGGILGVIILGAVGYFVVYPMLSSNSSGPVAPETSATQATTAPPATTPQPPAPAPHVSAFVNEPAQRSTVTLSGTVDRGVLSTILHEQAQQTAIGIHEIVFTETGNAPAPFAPFITIVAPKANPVEKTSALFADDFTAFIFKDQKGLWPGYIATLKPGFAPEDLRAWFSALEKSPITDFFMLTGAGTLSGFKDGIVGGKYPDRYAAGSAATGASFGYLVLPTQNKVLISTSYNGMKEALRLIGL